MGRRRNDDEPEGASGAFDPRKHELGIDGYRDGILVGQGGFGNVYKCYDPKFERTVAIKVLAAPALDETVRRRFETECRAIGALSGHPHIATVYDSGVNQWGRPYIVMEFMPGGSLADALRSGKPLAPPAVVDVGVKIAGAVAAAHRVGIQHRDVKPENILVSSFNEPKLCDFGISKLADGTQTRSGIVTASVTHTAPEIFDGAPATASSDIYSLGSTLFELLAGRPAFEVEGRSIASVVLRIMKDPVPDLRDRGVPPSICSAVERAMAKDPGDRFSSAEELADALAAAADVAQGRTATPTPVAAEPATADPAPRRSKKPSSPTLHHARHALLQRPVPAAPSRSRRPRLLAAAATIAVLLVAAGGTFAMRDGGGRSAAADPASARADTGNLEARKPSPSPEPAAATAPPRAPRKPKVVTAATRSLTIGFKKAAGSLHGRLGSPRDVCSARRVVRIMRRTPGADDVVGMRRTAASGWWTMHRPHADGTFYLLIAKAERRLPEGGRVVCGAVRSTPFTRHVPAPEPVAPDTANPAEPSTSVDTPSTNVAPVAPPPTPPAPTGPNPGGSVESAIEKAKDLW